MPKSTKAKAAAKRREEAKRLARESAPFLQSSSDGQLNLSDGSSTSQWTSQDIPMPQPNAGEQFQVPLEMQVTDVPVKPMLLDDIKQEAVEVEVNPFELNQVMEVKVELLEPTTEEQGPDPIAGQPSLLPPSLDVGEHQVKLEYEPEDFQRTRCQFCRKLFWQVGGRGVVSRTQIIFVLGFRSKKFLSDNPDCCKRCKRMFDQSFAFKKSCLAALESQMDSQVKKDPSEVVELKPSLEGEVVIVDAPHPKESRPVNDVPSMACQACKETFYEWSALEKHWLTHFDMFGQAPVGNPDISLPKDQETQQNTVELHCFRCQKWFQTELAFTQHKTLCSQNTMALQQANADFYCYRCNKWFKIEAIYRQHKPACIKAFEAATGSNLKPSTTKVKKKINTKTTKKTKSPKQSSDLNCRRCWKQFPTKELFVEHKPSCVKVPPPFACEQCPKRFTTEERLTTHINHHKKLRTVPCRREGCTKMLLNEDTRYHHEKICGKDVQILCSVCGAIFRSTGSLKIHMATHEEPKFPCQLCDKSFYSKANLKKHSSVHSDERKFECKVCGKRFKSHEANRVHQRIHTQEKPYVCHLCGMAFTYNCLLKTHLEKGHDSVHPERRELMEATSSLAMSLFFRPPE